MNMPERGRRRAAARRADQPVRVKG